MGTLVHLADVTSREVPPELRALNSTTATISFTVDGEIIRANARFLRLSGYELGEIAGRAESMLRFPEDAAGVSGSGLWQALAAGERRTVETRCRCKDGSELWIESDYCPLEDEDGRIFEIVALVRDISERVRIAADERGQIQAINASTAVMHLSLEGVVLDANANFLRAFGYRLDEVVGRHHRMFVEAAYGESEEYAEFWRSLARGAYKTAEFKRIGKGGREVWLQASYNPIFDAAGRPFKVVKYATDVTRERLLQVEYEWQVAAIHKSHAVVSFDMHGTVLDANETFLEALDYSLDEIVGRHHRMFVDPTYAHSAEYALFWRALARGHHQAGQYRRLDRQGGEVWLQASYNPVFDTGGRPIRIVEYATVITDEKLRQAEHQGQIAAIHKTQCVIEFALDGTVLDANDNFLEAMGYRLAEVRGRHHRMLVDPAYAESQEYAEFWRTLGMGAHHSGEYRRLTRHGRDVWLQAAYSPILDLGGRPIKIIKHAYVITEEKLRQADYEGQIAAISKSQGVISFALDGTILSANANILETFGYTLDEMVGRHHSILMDPGDAASADYEAFWSRLRSGAFVAGRHRRLGSNGRELWLQASYNPIFDLNGELIKIVKFATDVTEDVALAEAYADAKKQAQHDAATSLPNRTRLASFLAAELAAGNARVAVLYCDIDRFKAVNDTFGHQIGDRVLGEVADRLRRSLRGDQLVARVGGDEFVIVAPDLSEDEIESTCQSLLAAMNEPIRHDGGDLSLGVSIGVATSPGDGTSPDELIRNADAALYRAKQEGRGTYRFYGTEMNDRIVAARRLTEEMRRGIAAGEFYLEFQPRFNPRTQTIRSAEALIRWAHPERGRISPGMFIPVAERSGLILPLGEWTMRTACRTAATWQDIGVSVNVSPVQFRDCRFVDMVRRALDDFGLPRERLEIEITEGVLLEDAERARTVLGELKDLGVSLAIDDFGTGYASLSYLRSFPFDVIKIDRQFIADIEGREGGRAVVQAILGLGRALGLSVTAEGVETAGQLASLIRDQCDEVQGYLLAHPMPAAKLAEMLLKPREHAPEATPRAGEPIEPPRAWRRHLGLAHAASG